MRQLQLEKADVETTLLEVRIEQERKARLEKSKGHHRHLTENQLAKVYRALECICCFDATSKNRIFQCQSGHLVSRPLYFNTYFCFLPSPALIVEYVRDQRCAQHYREPHGTCGKGLVFVEIEQNWNTEFQTLCPLY